MTIPFYLAELGYKPDPTDPLKFNPPHDAKGKLYPVVFDDHLQKTSQDCIFAVAEAAYQQGFQDGCEEDLSDPGITDAERV